MTLSQESPEPLNGHFHRLMPLFGGGSLAEGLPPTQHMNLDGQDRLEDKPASDPKIVGA